MPRGPLAALLAALLLTGCASGGSWLRNPFAKEPTKPPAPEGDSLVLRGDGGVVQASAQVGGPAAEKMEEARELYRKNEYAKAQRVFRQLAEDKKNPPGLAEEARYYEAECLRQQGLYPKACDTYSRMLNDFPSGAYREQACQHMFDIANYWLDDTRKQMEQYKERDEGKRWFVTPQFVQFDRSKPILDEQGRALEALEKVRYNDITGPLADKSLFLMGRVHFWNQNYMDADHCFTQLVEHHPNSPLAEQAVELAIIAKHMSTGGSDYDGRKCAEARQMVHTALNSFPKLANEKNDFLNRQLVGITLQQAEKDFKVAEYYRRRGVPESAYFCYEVVRRRYPGTKYAEQATERMHELKAKVEQQQLRAQEAAAKGKDKPPAPPPPDREPPTLPPSGFQALTR